MIFNKDDSLSTLLLFLPEEQIYLFEMILHFILVLSIASSAESFLFILFCRFAAFLAIFSFCLLFDRWLPNH